VAGLSPSPESRRTHNLAQHMHLRIVRRPRAPAELLHCASNCVRERERLCERGATGASWGREEVTTAASHMHSHAADVPEAQHAHLYPPLPASLWRPSMVAGASSCDHAQVRLGVRTVGRDVRVSRGHRSRALGRTVKEGKARVLRETVQAASVLHEGLEALQRHTSRAHSGGGVRSWAIGGRALTTAQFSDHAQTSEPCRSLCR
jgi:hypothetical protein